MAFTDKSKFADFTEQTATEVADVWGWAFTSQVKDDTDFTYDGTTLSGGRIFNNGIFAQLTGSETIDLPANRYLYIKSIITPGNKLSETPGRIDTSTQLSSDGNLESTLTTKYTLIWERTIDGELLDRRPFPQVLDANAAFVKTSGNNVITSTSYTLLDSHERGFYVTNQIAQIGEASPGNYVKAGEGGAKMHGAPGSYIQVGDATVNKNIYYNTGGHEFTGGDISAPNVVNGYHVGIIPIFTDRALAPGDFTTALGGRNLHDFKNLWILVELLGGLSTFVHVSPTTLTSFYDIPCSVSGGISGDSTNMREVNFKVKIEATRFEVINLRYKTTNNSNSISSQGFGTVNALYGSRY